MTFVNHVTFTFVTNNSILTDKNEDVQLISKELFFTGHSHSPVRKCVKNILIIIGVIEDLHLHSDVLVQTGDLNHQEYQNSRLNSTPTGSPVT